MRMFRSMFLGGLAALAITALVVALPVFAALALAAPVLGLRRYRMTDTAWAQVQCVGFSLQIGGSIWGLAPESWFAPGRGRASRSSWPSCLAVTILSQDYNNGVRTALGLNFGSARLRWHTSGQFSPAEATGDLGWSFWARPLRS